MNEPTGRAAPAPSSPAEAYAALAALAVGGADLLLAAGLGLAPEPDPEVWERSFGSLDGRLVRPRGVAERDPEVLADLAEGLRLAEASGLAGRATAPALFARAWEAAGARAPHGFLLGVGAGCALAVWGAVLDRPFRPGDIPAALALRPAPEQRSAFVRSLFPEGPARETALAACRAKDPDEGVLRARLERFAEDRDGLRDRLSRQLMHLPRLRAMLAAAGAPDAPGAVGVPPARAAATVVAAQMIDPGYTVLDLAWDLGRLAEAAEAVRDAFADHSPRPAPGAS